MSTLVNADTGEIVAACTPSEARELTDRIRESAKMLWSLLAEAHEREAWRALGYASWRHYATAEFDFSESRAYQLLDAARIIAALERHASSTTVETPLPRNEGQARALAPLKDEPEHMADAMKRATADAKPATASGIRDAVKEIVREEVAKAAQRTEDREALADLARNAERAGMDLDEERQTQRGAFARLCRDLAAFPQPNKFLASQRDYLKPRHRAGAQAAHDWLTELLNEWGEA